MYRKKIIEMTLVATCLGCSPMHTVRYQSDPPGAVIYCEGERIGFAPKKVSYKITSQQEDEQQMRIKECTARWISGAKTEARDIITLLPNAHFSTSSYTFYRPDFPNYKEDERFAMEREKIHAIKSIARSNRSYSSYNNHDQYDHHRERSSATMKTPSSSKNTHSSSGNAEQINNAVASGLKLLK